MNDTPHINRPGSISHQALELCWAIEKTEASDASTAASVAAAALLRRIQETERLLKELWLRAAFAGPDVLKLREQVENTIGEKFD